MVRVKSIIYCKKQENLNEVKQKYPIPNYKWGSLKNSTLTFPMFIKRDKNEMEIYSITPLKAIQELNYIKNHTDNQKIIELCNRMIYLAQKEKSPFMDSISFIER